MSDRAGKHLSEEGGTQGSEASAAASGIRLSVVLTTMPDAPAAEALVTTLVEEGLIACGNIVPGVLSIYRWNGEVAREAEVLVVMKTVTEKVHLLMERLPAVHPYSVPELVGLSVGAVSQPYGEWVTESTRK
jgi:periplasmic divalent cation tolerance protein